MIFPAASHRNVNAHKTGHLHYRKQSHVHKTAIVFLVHVQMNVCYYEF